MTQPGEVTGTRPAILKAKRPTYPRGFVQTSMSNTSNNMHTRGIEPRSQAWKACMMPLHYVCDCITSLPKWKRDSRSVCDEDAGGVTATRGLVSAPCRRREVCVCVYARIRKISCGTHRCMFPAVIVMVWASVLDKCSGQVGT